VTKFGIHIGPNINHVRVISFLIFVKWFLKYCMLKYIAPAGVKKGTSARFALITPLTVQFEKH
jgi:hypothetical protein